VVMGRGVWVGKAAGWSSGHGGRVSVSLSQQLFAFFLAVGSVLSEQGFMKRRQFSCLPSPSELPLNNNTNKHRIIIRL
jgi:hypothetical protein